MPTTQEQKVPNLRFPEFSGEWRETKLGKLGTFKNGINKDKHDFGFGVPFVNLMDVFGKHSIDSKIQLDLVNASEKEIRAYNLKKDDALFIRSSVKRSGVGETIVILENLPNTVYSGFLIRFRENKGLLKAPFMQHCFWTIRFRNNLISLSTTSANTNINQESLKTVKIAYPSEKEQQTIASFLSSVDTIIGQLEKKKSLLEQYKKGMMQNLFSQEIRFKDEQGNDYPDWEEKRLGKIAEIIGGGTPDSTTSKYWNGKITWFTPTEIKQKYLSESKRSISSLGLSKSSAKLLPVGTLLLSSRATVGDVGIAQHECATNQGFQSLVVYEDNFNEFWYYWIIKNEKELLRRASGSTFLEISKKEIKKIIALSPTLSEQQKIADFLSAIDRKIELVDTELKNAQSFKKGLLQQMFV